MKVKDIDKLIEQLHNDKREAFSKHQVWLMLSEYNTEVPTVDVVPMIGHWSRKTKVEDVYDIEGVKTWGIKCQCDRCDFTTTVIEDFGYYKICPNCGAQMVEPQESEEE